MGRRSSRLRHPRNTDWREVVGGSVSRRRRRPRRPDTTHDPWFIGGADKREGAGRSERHFGHGSAWGRSSQRHCEGSPKRRGRYKELSAKFLRTDAKVGRKASTLSLYDLYFRIHILPAIGSKRANDVTEADIRKLHRQIGIEGEKTSTANRVVATLSGFFTWGIKVKEIDRTDNPARTVDLFKETSRERYLTTDELARLGAALREAETVGLPHLIDDTKPTSKHARKPENRRTIIDPFSAAAIGLLILTGARLREILHVRWTSVDLERGMLFLDDSKTGKKPIVLNAPAVQVLAALPRVGQFVIAGRSAATDDEAPRSDLHRPWAAVSKAAGLAAFAFMIFAIATHRSEPVLDWGYRSSERYWGIQMRRRPRNTRIWPTIPYGAPPNRSAGKLPPPWAKRRRHLTATTSSRLRGRGNDQARETGQGKPPKRTSRQLSARRRSPSKRRSPNGCRFITSQHAVLPDLCDGKDFRTK